MLACWSDKREVKSSENKLTVGSNSVLKHKQVYTKVRKTKTKSYRDIIEINDLTTQPFIQRGWHEMHIGDVAFWRLLAYFL